MAVTNAHEKPDPALFVRDVPDFPEPGIVFKDITPLLASPAAFRLVVDDLAAVAGNLGADLIAGVEARGFLFGAPVALAADCGFVPIRKPGKLPSATLGIDYALEYGTDRLELHVDAVATGHRVLLVDDVLATGGTAAASIGLLRNGGADVVGAAFVLEIDGLDGRVQLDDLPVYVAVSKGAR
ncbi:MAG: adenine phosphoribosyltransferase [Actinomycetia bacterium]|nr:adenine phosphoribosyltransferase [Actinomycetes bacterium]